MGDKDALKIAKKNMKRAQKVVAKEQKRHEKVREDKIASDARHHDH
jgi:hypothetical protein